MILSKRFRCSIGGLELPNPFILASGVLDMTGDLMIRIARDGAGAITTKSIGPEPKKGHIGPNVATTPVGIVNAMGLPNPGCEHFADEIRTYKAAKLSSPLIASVFGRTEGEFAHVAHKLEAAGADAIEINISCPHSVESLLSFGLDPVKTGTITASVRKTTSIPVFVKLPGNTNIPNFLAVAKSALENGAAGLVATNTLPAMVIDPRTGAPILGNIVGGLSGPAVHSVSVRLVYELARITRQPIIGVGGVSELNDAIDFFSVGATAVQVGSGVIIHDTRIFSKLSQELNEHLIKLKMKHYSSLVGRTLKWITEHQAH